MTCKIPRIIHQIWMQGWENVPSKFDENRAALRRLNPTWTIKEWDEASLRTECAALGPDYVRTFDELPLLISKVDFGRYVVIYRYGGVSLDLDMQPRRPLDMIPGLGHHAITVSRTNFGNLLINNAVFIACARNPVVHKLLLSIINSSHRLEDYPTKDMYVHFSTGPILLSRLLLTTGDDVNILDSTYFEPCLPMDHECTGPDTAIMVHRHELSWMSDWMIRMYRALLTLVKYWYVLILLGLAVYYKAELKRGLHLIR